MLAWDKTPKNLEEIIDPKEIEEERLAAEAAAAAAREKEEAE